MKITYRNSAWLTARAKSLEKQLLKRDGRSLTFVGIENYLTKGADRKSNAIIELRDCDEKGCVIVLDEGQYQINMTDFKREYGLTV